MPSASPPWIQEKIGLPMKQLSNTGVPLKNVCLGEGVKPFEYYFHPFSKAKEMSGALEENHPLLLSCNFLTMTCTSLYESFLLLSHLQD